MSRLGIWNDDGESPAPVTGRHNRSARSDDDVDDGGECRLSFHAIRD